MTEVRTPMTLSERAAIVNEIISAPENPGTTNVMEVGDTFEGELQASGDVDWIAIDLVAGESYIITMDEVAMDGDPLLFMFDSFGALVGFNGDIDANNFQYNAQIEFTASFDATYYIVADAHFGANTGTYEVEVQTYVPSVADPLDMIDWGTEVPGTSTSGGTLDVFLATSGYSYFDTVDNTTYVAEAWSGYETGQVEAAFDLIASVTNLTFNYVTTSASADLILINDTNQLDPTNQGLLGFFNPPGTSNAGTGVFAANNWDDFAGGDLEMGGKGFQTLVHEILHGLGLAHPHDDGGSSDVWGNVTNAFDDAGDFSLAQGIYTTMSYNSGFLVGPFGTPSDNFDFGLEAGPMALDIALLQEKYGANTSTNTGKTTYTLGTTNASGTHWKSIWDASGNDWIVHTGTARALIDLREATLLGEVGGGGFISVVEGVQGGYTIANGVVIENAEGGSAQDLLQGNDVDNDLIGNAGDDIINGRGGNDDIFGGADNDELYGGDGRDEITGGGGEDEIYGDKGNDSISGGSNNDFIDGGTGKDEVFGGGGDDEIYGDAHKDKLYGENGTDTIYGGADNDKIFGGDGDDELYGDDRSDFLTGNDGSDYLYGGINADELLGGNGDDFLFGGDNADILAGGKDDDNLFGGKGQDELKGNSGTDVLYGGSGKDNIFGGNDDDTISGGEGQDTLSGGDGADTFLFYELSGNDTVTDLELSDAILIDTVAAGFQTAQQIADDAIVSGGNTIITLEPGSSITLEGFTNTTALAGMITVDDLLL